MPSVKLLNPGRTAAGPPGQPQSFGPAYVNALRAAFAPAGVSFELHPSTEPEEIARTQRSDVRAALARLGPDVAAIAEAVLLCPWSVRRRLAEVRGDPSAEHEGHGTAAWSVERRRAGPLVLSALAAGPATAGAINLALAGDAPVMSTIWTQLLRLERAGKVARAGFRREPGSARRRVVWKLVDPGQAPE